MNSHVALSKADTIKALQRRMAQPNPRLKGTNGKGEIEYFSLLEWRLEGQLSFRGSYRGPWMVSGRYLGDQFDRLMDVTRTERPFSALSVSIIRGSEIHYEAGSGRCGHLPQSSAVDGNSLFRIGSVCKLVTSLLVLALVDRSQTSLDTPLSEQFPHFGEAWRDVGPSLTFRHLLSHTSGIRAFELPYESAYFRDSILAADRARVLEPGRAHIYSNANYQLAGLLIEQLAGESFSEFASAALFEPLGIPVYLEQPSEHMDRLVSSISTWSESPRYDEAESTTLNRLLDPASGGIASVRSLARLVQMINRSGTDSTGKRIFSEAAIKELLHPNARIHVPGRMHYSLGLFIDLSFSPAWFHLPGHVGDFVVDVHMSPERQYGVVVARNFLGDYAEWARIQRAVDDIRGSRVPTMDLAQQLTDSGEVYDLTGEFRSEVGIIRILQDANGYLLQMGEEITALKRTTPDVYISSDNSSLLAVVLESAHRPNLVLLNGFPYERVSANPSLAHSGSKPEPAA